MKIERSNILELIGTGKNKYHSCVITSYSIDLAFFEQLILPRLRGAGITNINLFVDASMLEKYLASHLAIVLKSTMQIIVLHQLVFQEHFILNCFF